MRTILGIILLGSTLTAQEKVTTPAPTEVDLLQLQVVLLQSQLSQALATTARCEVEGSQSAKVAAESQLGAQALLSSLDARGLTIDQTNKIVAKPEAPTGPNEPIKPAPSTKKP